MAERHSNPDSADGPLPLRVYVPRDGTPARAAIAEQSGVVGSPGDEGRLILDYEANMYGAVNIYTFADKVHHAAGRHTSEYPTRARTEVDRDTVTEVGLYDGKEVTLHPDTRSLVARWLEIEEDALSRECRRSGR